MSVSQNDHERDEDEQERTWSALYDQIEAILRQFGTEDHFGEGDYLLVNDNYGWRRHTIEIHKLPMLNPEIVKLLKPLLRQALDWEIVIAVDIPGTEMTWPRMGLTIRDHEIIDGLQRQFLPEECRSLSYEGSRPGTGYD
jgi:hypothetical protein